VFETLHSIQSILFHFDDQRSSRVLAKEGFDEDCAQCKGYRLFNTPTTTTPGPSVGRINPDDGNNPKYLYWGERLASSRVARIPTRTTAAQQVRAMDEAADIRKSNAFAHRAGCPAHLDGCRNPEPRGLAGFQFVGRMEGVALWKEPVEKFQRERRTGADASAGACGVGCSTSAGRKTKVGSSQSRGMPGKRTKWKRNDVEQ